MLEKPKRSLELVVVAAGAVGLAVVACSQAPRPNASSDPTWGAANSSNQTTDGQLDAGCTQATYPCTPNTSAADCQAKSNSCTDWVNAYQCDPGNPAACTWVVTCDPEAVYADRASLASDIATFTGTDDFSTDSINPVDDSLYSITNACRTLPVMAPIDVPDEQGYNEQYLYNSALTYADPEGDSESGLVQSVLDEDQLPPDFDTANTGYDEIVWQCLTGLPADAPASATQLCDTLLGTPPPPEALQIFANPPGHAPPTPLAINTPAGGPPIPSDSDGECNGVVFNAWTNPADMFCNFTPALQNLQCKDLETLYLPGIQGYDDDTVGIARRSLGGDGPSANLYLKYAKQSGSAFAPWSVASYFNAPTDALGGVDMWNRIDHSTNRYNRKTGAGGTWFGDQGEVRLLGLWAAMDNSADFRSSGIDWDRNNPRNMNRKKGQPWILKDVGFIGAKQPSNRDKQDYNDWRLDVTGRKWWLFMRPAAYLALASFKCGRPVFAHSGGGAVTSWILRAIADATDLTAKTQNLPLRNEIMSWPIASFQVNGLEAVLSTELGDFLAQYGVFQNAQKKMRLVMHNFLAPPVGKGSGTWRNPISREMKQYGLTPLANGNNVGNGGAAGNVYSKADPPGWNGDGPGHCGVGLYALRDGYLPNSTGSAAPADRIAFQTGQTPPP